MNSTDRNGPHVAEDISGDVDEGEMISADIARQIEKEAAAE